MLLRAAAAAASPKAPRSHESTPPAGGAAVVFTGRLVVVGTHARPGTQVPSGGEPRHVCAGWRPPVAEPRNLPEVGTKSTPACRTLSS